MDNYHNERQMVNNASGLNAFLTKMYGIMGLAVLLSAITAYFFGNVLQDQLMALLSMNRWMMWLSMIAWFAVPFVVSSQALKRPTLGLVTLLGYAVLSGFAFSTIFLTYTASSIASAFASAAAVFVSMSVFGMVTKKNLDKLGAQAQAALIALVVAMLINLFLKSSAVGFVFSIIAVVIFTILTAYDTQKMKRLYNQNQGELSVSGLAVLGALQLYMDFVNLFLQLLSILGVVDER